MKNYMFPLTREEVRSLCIRRGWFTSGTSSQYEKLFRLVDDGADLETLARLVWLCSDEVEYDEILHELRQLSAWTLNLDCLADTLRRAEWGETEIEIITAAIRTIPAAGTSYRIV